MSGDSSSAPSARAPDGRDRCWALILAGGSGARLARNCSKAFVPLANRPLLYWSVAAFARHPAITDVLAVVPSGWEGAFRDQILQFVQTSAGGQSAAVTGSRETSQSEMTARIHSPVVGGARRQDSARSGLEAIRAMTPDGDREETLVLIHDAARPIVPAQLIADLIGVLRMSRDRAADGGAAGGVATAGVGADPVGVLPVLPVEDTLKTVSWADNVDGKGEESGAGRGMKEAGLGCRDPHTGRVTRTVSRKGLWRAQTPQGFFLESILEAHVAAAKADVQATDDAMLYEWRGWPMEAVPGSPINVKVTYPEDLALLGASLGVGQEDQQANDRRG
jgi:2-C-methyl-D-erythritol 4-phosphate cytidylyltransferase/2-C-methyl-D-erythritol 2,4-cyclodiphosphate synthase